MRRVDYRVAIGALTASADPRRGTCRLLGLLVEIGMDGPGECIARFSPVDDLPAIGDAVRIELDGGDGLVAAFTGEVSEAAVDASGLRVVAADGLARLARWDVEAAYVDQTAGAIVSDVLGQAGVAAGTIDDGPELAAYTLHRGPRALAHLSRLAELCGADLYGDGDGKAHFAPPAKGAAAHRFGVGRDLVDFRLERVTPPFDSVAVWGEGAGSAQGAAKNHWLMTDLASVSAQAALGAGGAVVPGKVGDTPLTVTSGAVRTGAVARDLASRRMTAVAARLVRGSLLALGAPAIAPGALVAVDGLASSSPGHGRVLRARRLRHTIDGERGFLTRVGF